MPGAPAIDPIKAAEVFPLAAMGYNSRQIENQTGINQRTVRYILDGHGRWGELVTEKPVYAELIQQQTRAMVVALSTANAQALAEAYTATKLKAASYRDLMVGFGIGVQNMRLLMGESTANVDVHVQVNGLDELAGALSQCLLASPVDNPTK